MSDLLIQGMEMPEYGVPVYIEPNGAVWVYPEHGKLKYHAISVHPHGRLIDADALIKAMFTASDGTIIGNTNIDGWHFEMKYADIKRHIRAATTVVEASE